MGQLPPRIDIERFPLQAEQAVMKGDAHAARKAMSRIRKGPGQQTETSQKECRLDPKKLWCVALGIGVTFRNAVDYEVREGIVELRHDDSEHPAELAGVVVFRRLLEKVPISPFVTVQFKSWDGPPVDGATAGLTFDLAAHLSLAAGFGIRRVKKPRPGFVRAADTALDGSLRDDDTRFDGFDPKKIDYAGNPLVGSTDKVWFVGVVVPVHLFGR